MKFLKTFLFCLAIVASASSPIFGSSVVYEDITDDSAFTWAGTFIFAHRFGSSTPVTVNGVEFTQGSSTASGSFGASPSVTPVEFDTLLSAGVYSNINVSYSGLIIDQEYELQLFFSNNDSPRTMNVVVEGVQQLGTPFSLGVFEAAGVVTTFVAADTTLNFTIVEVFGAPVLSAATLQAVPEPTTITLAGISSLALFLRSRKRAR